MTSNQPLAKKQLNKKTTLLRDLVLFGSSVSLMWILLYPEPIIAAIISAVLSLVYAIKIFSIKKDTRFFNLFSGFLAFGSISAWMSYTYDFGSLYTRISVIFIFFTAVISIYYIFKATQVYSRGWHYQLRDASTAVLPAATIASTAVIINNNIVNLVILLTISAASIIYFFHAMIFPAQKTNKIFISLRKKYTENIQSDKVSKLRKTLKNTDAAYATIQPIENSSLSHVYGGRKRIKKTIVTTILLNNKVDNIIRGNTQYLSAFSGRNIKKLPFVSGGQKPKFRFWIPGIKGKTYATILVIESPNKIKQTIKITIADEVFYIVSISALKNEYKFIEQSI